MREYQRSKKNPYILPHHLYMRVLYIIRDYERLKQKSADGKCDESQVAICKSAEAETKAIETALSYVPEFYRTGVMENIMDGTRYPSGADERTFRRHKQRYIYYVAKLLNCI